jgi:hypothetical protein
VFVGKCDNYFWGEEEYLFSLVLLAVHIEIEKIDVYLRCGQDVVLPFFALRKGVELYFLLPDLHAALEGVVVDALPRGVEEELLAGFLLRRLKVIGNQ